MNAGACRRFKDEHHSGNCKEKENELLHKKQTMAIYHVVLTRIKWSVSLPAPLRGNASTCEANITTAQAKSLFIFVHLHGMLRCRTRLVELDVSCKGSLRTELTPVRTGEGSIGFLSKLRI